MDVFATDKGIVEEVWRNDPNYYVRDINPENKKCLILFSSNGLYFPNTKEAFIEKIVENDRYEFRNVTNCKKIEKQFGKIIYVRDLWRAWYVKGINAKEDTIDKQIEKLRELLGKEKWQIVTAGISSGGYMAVVAGIKLDAQKVLCFSGQFCFDLFQKRGIIKEYEEDEKRNQYFDITELIRKSDVPIIYFYPAKSDGDIKQAEQVKGFSNVIMFAFDYAEHAQTVYPYNFKYLFDMSEERYRKINRWFKKKAVKALPFLIITGGIESIMDCFTGTLFLIRRKLMNGKIEIKI